MNLLENLKIALIVLVVFVVGYLLWVQLFELISQLQVFLDQFIWSFFAWIIALIFAIWLVYMMFLITVWVVAAIISLIAAAISIFVK
jgi:hypothetical protein